MLNFSLKQLAEIKEQLKKQVLDLDHQINELQTFYIEDTKEAGNILKGFDNYISLKTSKIQSMVKKQKVQNYERLFSLSSVTSKTSQILEESYIGEPIRFDSQQQQQPKRNRPRQGGMTKTGGKHLMSRQEENNDDSDESGQPQNNQYSVDDSVDKNKIGIKKKKITKTQPRRVGV